MALKGCEVPGTQQRMRIQGGGAVSPNEIIQVANCSVCVIWKIE